MFVVSAVTGKNEKIILAWKEENSKLGRSLISAAEQLLDSYRRRPFYFFQDRSNSLVSLNIEKGQD